MKMISPAKRAAANFSGTRILQPTISGVLASKPDIVELQVEQAKQAADRGVFGAPTFFVEGEMFFGNDRLSFVEARLNGRSQPGAVA